MNKKRSSLFARFNLAVVVLFIFTSGMGSPTQAQAQAENIGGSVSYSWHTFYGTRYDRDRASALTVDSSGNTYIVGDGSAVSWNGPTGQPPIQPHNIGNVADLFLLKLNSFGEYQWHTFFGSAGGCSGTNNATNTVNNVALDSSGNIIVEGTSCASWGTPLHAHSGVGDHRTNLFVAKFDKNGNYLWNTFYEQKNMNASMGKREIALDGNGNIYVGTTAYYSWDGPSGQAPLHPHTTPVANIYDSANMLILKFNSNGAYAWHTFYGTNGEGDGPDWVQDIAADDVGNVFVTGSGAMWGAPLHSNQGSTDIIVMSLDTNGIYQWHTYYGSEKVDEGEGITIDDQGYLYVTGAGRPFLGPMGQFPLHAFSDNGNTADNSDTFVIKLTTSGSYVWHTWFGALNDEMGYSNKTALDSTGSIYLTGLTYDWNHPYASWNGPDGEPPISDCDGSRCFYILKMDKDGSYQWHMFFSDPDTWGFGVALDPNDNMYIAGHSKVTWNGPNGELPLRAFPGSATILKYRPTVLNLTALSSTSAMVGSDQFNLTVSGENFIDGAVVQWNGIALATTWVNANTLTAVVPQDKLLNAGVASVRVVNPPPDEATSNPLYIFITQTGAEVTSQGSAENSEPTGTAQAIAGGTSAFTPGTITATGSGTGGVVVGIYSANPGGSPTFSNNTAAYTDVHILPGSSFTSLSIVNCILNGGNQTYWWNGSSWVGASNQSYDSATGCITITVNGSTSPNLNDLEGTPFATGFSGSRIYLPTILR